MTGVKPYKVVLRKLGEAYELGAADIVDRATDRRIGYVLGGAGTRWSSFICPPVPSVLVGTSRYRTEAAEKVWVWARAASRVQLAREP